MKKRYLQSTYLFRKFQKVVTKLSDFIESGTFEQLSLRKQRSLVGKFRRLYNQLNSFVPKKALNGMIAAGSILLFSFVSTNAQAQTFAAPQQNPFGMTPSTILAIPTFADLDGDGDLDMIQSDPYGNILYFQNIGNTTTPNFSAPVTNPFGLTQHTISYFGKIELADIDNDGDIDVFAGADYYGDTYYYENSGTATNPTFSAPQINPFNLNLGEYDYLTFADMDNDGDLDLLTGEYYGDISYYQNTGTASNPSFGARVMNPFGIQHNVAMYSAFPALVDIDRDGDLDLFVGGEGSGNTIYFQNTGTASNPAFAPHVTNPFGLSISNSGYLISVEFADIDGDGDLDLFQGEFYGDIRFFRNTTPGVGIKEVFTGKIEVYPNPASDYIMVNSDVNLQNATVEITGIKGNKIISTDISSDRKIDISDLPAATYIIKVIADNEVIKSKRIVKH